MRCRRRRGSRGRGTGGSGRRWRIWRPSGRRRRQEQAAKAEGFRERQRAGQRTGCSPDSAAVELAEEKLARVTAAQQAKIDDWQARNAASLAETGKPLRNPPRRPASEHCRVKEAAAQVEKARARAAGGGARAAEREKNRKGPGPVRNITDPDSRLMPVRGGGFIQGYNTQNVTSEDELIIATELTDDPADMAWFEPMMAQGRRGRRPDRGAPPGRGPRPGPRLSEEQAGGGIGLALADAGYCSEANLTCPGPDRLIAVGKHRDLEKAARGQDTGGRTGAARPSRRCASG